MSPRAAGIVLLGMLLAPVGYAEPYFAVQEGLKCATCHVNPDGGGMRNAFGNVWAQTQLPARQPERDEYWTGLLNAFVGVGANLRTNAIDTRIPNQSDQFEFTLQEVRAYLDVNPLPGRVGVYVDQRIAPGGSINREAYGRLHSANGNWYLKAGQMYLPYGLRIEDDSAFVRQASGINFTTPDRGVAAGWEAQHWSLQAAMSNGTAGGAETDRGKQFSLRAEHIQAGWRAGASVNVNDTAIGTRHMQNLFGGLRTGPVAWLVEVNHISDDTLIVRRTLWAGLLEANWRFRPGHNLKVSAEFLDPDADASGIGQNRISLVWEHVPLPFMQFRVGLRAYDGPSGADVENRTVTFAQAHAFF